MTFYQDNVAFVPSPPKLPSIKSASYNGRSNTSLVVSQWMGPLRRKLDHSINFRGYPHQEDVDELSQGLIKVFIQTLQSSFVKQTWLDLDSILSLVQPYGFFLKSAPFFHYVERLCAYYTANTEKLYDVPIIETLKKVFPECVARCNEGGTLRWQTKMETSVRHSASPASSKKSQAGFFGEKNPFILSNRIEDPIKKLAPKKLTLSAIEKSIGSVTFEKAQSESIRRSGYSAVGTAANIEFPGMFTNVIEEDESSVAISEISPRTPRERMPLTTSSHDFHSISGREAVELFLNHKHLHKVKFIYLNVAKNQHFSPYDLVSVPRDHIEKEHYIFSSFGVLHVYPEGDQSETYTLAEWNKAAVVWSALRKISFFKNYLIHKIFYRWRANVKMLKYLQAREMISSNLLHATPDYGSALLHVFRLIHELSEVNFFPVKPDNRFHCSIGEFAAESQAIRSEAKDILELFFCYSKRVVEVTKETCHDRLKYYEEQARHVKPLYLKESMYLQRVKAQLRQKNLEEAKTMALQLSRFISLIDQAVAVHLVELARRAVKNFVYSVICAYEDEEVKNENEEEDSSSISLNRESRHHSILTEPRDDEENDDIPQPLFSAKFVFNDKTCLLEMQPSIEKFEEIIFTSFQQIFDLICAEAYSMHAQENSKSRKSSKRPNSAPPSLSSLETSDSCSISSSESGSRPNVEISSQDLSNQQKNGDRRMTKNNLITSPFKSKRSNLMTGLTKPDISTFPQVSAGEVKNRAVTPNLVISTDRNDLLGMVVGGQKIYLEYNPLERKKLNERFYEDEEIVMALEKRDEFIDEAIKDLTDFCNKQNEWIPEIRNFCNNWTENDAVSYRGRPPQEIEDLMTKIKQWIAKVENMPQFLITRNKVLYVDGRNLHNTLVPQLNSVFKNFVTTIVTEANKMSLEITEDVHDTLRILKNKDTSMTSFAAYASKVNESLKKKEEMAKKVSYTRSIYDVIKMTCRPLTPEEESSYQKAKSSWETFLFQLKDASNFVGNQRPIIKRKLDEMFRQFHTQILDVSVRGSCHPITDPNSDPTQVIDILESCISEYQDLRGKITEISFFHEAICHEFYDVDDLKDLGDILKYKLELWQYFNTSKHTIHEWRSTPFRKFQPVAALNKLEAWKLKAVSLASSIGCDDVVLAVWQEVVDELFKQMPFMVKLSRDAIKTRHWKEIFTGMGESYEPGLSLIVDDLLGFRLFDHSALINRVYQDAASEYTVEKLLTSIKKDWENRQFDLAKHIYPVKVAKSEQVFSMNTKSGRHLNRQLIDNSNEPSTHEQDSDTFVLIGVEKLTTDLTESHVTLQAMFQSRHAIEVKNDAEIWRDTLSQIEEIVNLWVSCQEKWMYLNRVFNGDSSLAKRFSQQQTRFDSVDKQYRIFIDSMQKDAKILSVLSRRHGSKGWRELQGEVLRKHLVNCIQEEDEILNELQSLLADFRSQFPRFYFLSNEDCIRLLGISGHPRGFLPYVRKCFKGAQSLVFSLPHSVKSDFHLDDTGSNIKFDLELHSARLEATHVLGANDECLEIEPLPASNDATLWLSSLEQKINQSMVQELKDCIENRIKLDSLCVSDAFNELCESEADEYSPNVSSQCFRHWMLKYTMQTILLCDSVLWCRDLRLYLIDGKRKEVLERLKKQAIHNLRQYGLALNDNMPHVGKSPVRIRFQSVLSALITQTAYYKELLKSVADESVTEDSFEWQKLLKHKVEIIDYKYPGYVVEENVISSDYVDIPLNQSANVGRCHVEQFDHSEDYGYEYSSSMTSNNRGLCIGTAYTPLTEKCMIDMWLTIRQEQCAGLFGPHGVGKSVVLAELARVFGKLHINFNCSETTPIELLKRLLCGMVESGAWICFDHAQRLTSNVLAMLSQYIKQIQKAYHTVNCAVNTQYTVRGDDTFNKLKRSNSITTLHRSRPDRSNTAWKPSVGQDFLDSIEITRFEDYDADDYSKDKHASSKPVGSIAFDNRLLRCKRGFSPFFSFTNKDGLYPDVPDSLRLIYRPTCVSKPDRQKLIEVWLLSSGFFDASNLSVKLNSMFELMNKNNDHITADRMNSSTNATNTKLAELNLRTLKSIISVAAMINHRMGVQRSRAESATSTTKSDISSLSNSSRLSRRSELALQSHQEELSLVDSILNILSLRLPDADSVAKLKDYLRIIFPLAARAILPGDKDTKVAVAVQQQILTDELRHSSELVDKICQLHAMLQINQTVVIAGLPGSGKTTLYRLLSKALNNLCNESTLNYFINEEEEILIQEPSQIHNDALSSSGSTSDSNPLAGVSSLSDIINKPVSNWRSSEDLFSRIDLSVLYPNVYSTSDLYGCYDPLKANKQGLLEKLLKSSMKNNEANMKKDAGGSNLNVLSQSPVDGAASGVSISKTSIKVKKWIVFDGEIYSSWVDNLSCLLDDHKRSSTDKLDELHLKSSTHFIMEASDFSSASPALASRCAIVHCNLPDQWRHIANVWLDSAYSQFSVRQNCVEMWRELLFEIVPKTLRFLSEHNSSVLKEGLTSSQREKTFACPGVHEIQSFLDLFSSCMNSTGLSRSERTAEDRYEALQEKKKTNLGRLNSANTMTTTTRTGSVRSRMENVPAANFQKSMNVFGFAFVWAFGGALLEHDMPMFDAFTRHVFSASKSSVIKFPKYETVFDYFVDEESGQFTLWEDKIDLRTRPGVGQDILAYTPVHQFEKYAYISNCLLSNNKLVLLVGKQGCGKSSLVKNMIQTELDLTKISISPGLKASQFQKLVESKSSPVLRQHNLGLMAHPTAVIASRAIEPQSTLFFLDDLSCAATSDPSCPLETKSQPLVELLRQIINIRGVYENERLIFKTLENEIVFIVTSSLPSQCGAGFGYKQQPLSPRLTRFFTVLNFLQPTRESILSIYHHSVQSWLEEFPTYALQRHYDLSQAIIAGLYDLYVNVSSHLKPTPRHPHYVFSLHDINKVIRGMFLLKPATRGRPIPLRHRGVNEKIRRPKLVGGKHNKQLINEETEGEILPMMRTIVRLWLHECSRVFYDRLCSADDRSWFSNLIQTTLKNQFCTGPAERPSTPAEQDDETRIIKTPLPSAGSSTVPSTNTESESASNVDFTQDSGTIDNTQSEFEFETSTTHGTDYLIDDDASSRGITPMLNQEAVGRTSSLGGKVSSSSMQLTPKRLHAASALSSGNKGDDEFDSFSPSSGLSPQSRADDFGRTSTSQSQVTDGYVSKAMTTTSGEDDTQSGVTGYTTEAESAMETEASYKGTSVTSESETNPTSLTSSSLKDPTPFPTITALEPSAGPSDLDLLETGKRERPSFGRSKVVRPGGAKFGVTFVPGLVEQDEISGQSRDPLVPYDQILAHNENPTSIIFCQANLSAPRLPDKSASAYSEIKPDELAQSLYSCLDIFNSEISSDHDRLELAFFSQAVCHVTRLSRALCLNGGHAFLMSSSPFNGRRSLTRLVVFFSHAEIFWVKNRDKSNSSLSLHEQLKEVMKEASYQAGIKDSKVVLFVEEDASNDVQCIDDLCSLIRDGQCPSLYNHNELAEVAASVSPSTSQTLVSTSEQNISLKKKPNLDVRATDSRTNAQDKLDKSLEFYFSRILKNLHVVVMASIPVLEDPDDLQTVKERKSKNLYFHKRDDLKDFYHLLRRCPDLITRFTCVDLYRDWEHSSWKGLAQNFVEDSIDIGIDDMPWSEDLSRLEHVQNVSHLMAYIHKDASSRIRASLQNGANRLISPLLLRQMVQVFVGLAMEIKYAEEINIRRLKKALWKVSSSDVSINKLKSDRDLILPMLQDAKKSEHSWKSVIEDQRREYNAAKERCNKEEEHIKTLDVQVDNLRTKTEMSFKKLHPLYKVASVAQAAVSAKYLEEIRRYSSPPEAAVEVVTCLCEMFHIKPANWENGKLLIGRENFYEDLIFYNKENIPENIFLKLEDRVTRPEFKPSRINRGCVPAAKLCEWIHAIYRYAKKVRAMEPDVNALSHVERDLLEAQAILGEKRVRCIEIKENLDIQISKYKNASIAAKQYEKKLKKLDNQVQRASALRETIRDYSEKWRAQLEESYARLNSAVGDAIIVAACVTYFGLFASEQKDQALQQWLNAAKNGYVEQKSGMFAVDLQSDEAKEAKEVMNESLNPHIRVDSASVSNRSNEIESESSFSSSLDRQNDFMQVRKNLTPINLLMTPNELRNWHKNHLSQDPEMKLSGARLYAMTVYQTCSWIFLFDPDDEASVWISASMSKMRNTISVIEKERTIVSDDKTSSTRPSSALPSEIIEEPESEDDMTIDFSGDETGDDTGGETTGDENEETHVQISLSLAEVAQNLITTKIRSKSGRKKRRSRKKQSKTPQLLVPEQQPRLEEVTAKGIQPLFSVEQLWTCAANEDRLEAVLENAMAVGAFLLVTNVELATPSNSEILRKLHSIRTFSILAKEVHPCFRLFLSTSVSLSWAFESSSSLIPVPLHHYTVTDLSLTEFCIRERLEYLVLGQERSEFETQRRLMETDRLHLEEQIDRMFLDLLETVGAVRGSLLDSDDINHILETCKEGLFLSYASLKELKGMEANLLQKKVDFNRVREHGLMLYKTISLTSIIDPLLYHLNATKFIEMFQDCLRKCKKTKSKSVSGLYSGTMVKSRVSELNQQLTEQVLRYANRKYFQIDVAALTTLVSLNILVMSGQLSIDNMEEFLASPDVDTSDFKHETYDDVVGESLVKPSWISDSIWKKLILLERKSPDRFRELTQSISHKPNRWKEYFSSPPMLLSKVPHNNLHDLKVGEKALLWKIMKPKKFTQIAADLNASVLSGINNSAYHFDLDALLEEIPATVPCVFVLPSNYNDSCFLPAHHVTCEAKTRGIQYVQMSALVEDKLEDATRECMKNGKWLILDDCHQIKKWPSSFVLLITNFITSAPTPTRPRSPFLSGKGRKLKTASPAESSSSGFQFSSVHSDFRLWMIMKKSPSSIIYLPVILMQNSEFIALETTTSHKDLIIRTHHTLSQASRFIRPPSDIISDHRGPSFFNRVTVPYNVQAPLYAPSSPSESKKTILLQLSLLFSSILERSEFGKSAFSSYCSWTDGELLDVLKSVFYMKDTEFMEEIYSLFLERHVPDTRDASIVKQLIKLCLAPVEENERVKRNIFSKLIEMSRNEETIDHIFNTLLHKPDMSKLGLVPSSAVEWSETSAFAQSDILNDIRNYKSMRRGSPTEAKENFLIISAREETLKKKLEEIDEMLEEIRPLKLNLGILSVVMLDFYAGEVERINTIINLIESDVKLSLAAVKNEVELTNEIHSLLECFERDNLARHWLDTRKELFFYHTSLSFTQYVKFLADRVELLSKYMEHAVCSSDNSISAESPDNSSDPFRSSRSTGDTSSPSSSQGVLAYNLAAFTKPDLFLSSVILAIARSQQQNPHRYKFETKIVANAITTKPQHFNGAFETVYIEKLRLHQAVYDTRGENLHHSISPNSQVLPWLELKAVKKSPAWRQPYIEVIQSYPCPLWINERKKPTMCSDDDVILHVPISTEFDPEEWLMKGVSMTSYLGED